MKKNKEKKPDFSFNGLKKEPEKEIKEKEEIATPGPEPAKPDFKFSDITKEIDNIIDRKKKSFDPNKEFKLEHISDRIKFAKTVKEQPPEKGYMKIEAKDAKLITKHPDGSEETQKAIAIISEHEVPETDPEKRKQGITTKIKKKIALYDGLFNIDLNVDAYWWFVRSCNVFPTILDQGIRTHLDIKKAHEPEKRKHEIPWILIGLGITGLMLIFLIFHYMTRGG